MNELHIFLLLRSKYIILSLITFSFRALKYFTKVNINTHIIEREFILKYTFFKLLYLYKVI